MDNTDNNIVESVYEALDAHTDKIAEVIAEREKIEERINAGRYSPQALRDEIYPKRDALRRQSETMKTAAFKDAESMIAQYRQDVAEANQLDPADLTDDVKLLQPGIILTPEDIQGMLRRNQSNNTMLQIILRYAKENDIDTGGTYYIGGQQEEETARNLEGILYYFKNWIDKPQGKKILREFFGVEND